MPIHALALQPHNNTKHAKINKKKRGLTQKELSVFNNISLISIKQYELGTRDLSKAALNVLIRLSMVLDCTIEDLISQKEIKHQFNIIYQNIIKELVCFFDDDDITQAFIKRVVKTTEEK